MCRGPVQFLLLTLSSDYKARSSKHFSFYHSTFLDYIYRYVILVWRKYEDVALCTSNRSNCNYEWIVSCVGCQEGIYSYFGINWRSSIWMRNMHYIDMIAMASQINGILAICSTVCSVWQQRKNLNSASLAPLWKPRLGQEGTVMQLFPA